MKNQRVSIVTPSLDQGKFIEETILSVLNQTHKEIEYIIVDGGSSDNTPEILRKYRGNFKLVQGQDSGQTDAINIGMKMSDGALVGWLNADDVLESTGVERVVEAFEQDPNCSIYYGASLLIDRNGEFLGVPKLLPLTFNNLIRGKPCFIQPGSFYPRHLIRHVGYLDIQLKMAMDVDLFLKLLKVAEARFIPTVVSRSRLHSVSKTSRFQRTLFREGIMVRSRHGASWRALSVYVFQKWVFLLKSLVLENPFFHT